MSDAWGHLTLEHRRVVGIVIGVLKSDRCGAQMCRELIPMGAGLCERHEAEAAASGKKFVGEIEWWLAARESEKEQRDR